MSKISDRQLKLLCDLAALQKAGYICDDSTTLVCDGYDAGSQEVDIPGVITYDGAEVAKDALADKPVASE